VLVSHILASYRIQLVSRCQLQTHLGNVCRLTENINKKNVKHWNCAFYHECYLYVIYQR